ISLTTTWARSISVASWSGLNVRGRRSIAHSVPIRNPSDVRSGAPAYARTYGSPTTTGLSANRASAVASGTTNTESPWIAYAQNAMSRDVSLLSPSPTHDLNHW